MNTGNPDTLVQRDGVHQEIDQDRFNYMFEVLPPLWIAEVDGMLVKNAFACSEAYTHSPNAIVLTVCYEKDGKLFECLAEVFTAGGKAIWDTHAYCYSRGNKAKTYKRKVS